MDTAAAAALLLAVAWLHLSAAGPSRAVLLRPAGSSARYQHWDLDPPRQYHYPQRWRPPHYIDRRLGHGHPDSHNSVRRRPSFPRDREQSIADYVKRYNHQYKPHAAYSRPGLHPEPIEEEEEEIIVHTDPHELHGYPGHPHHKDMTKASFPGHDPSSDFHDFIISSHPYSDGSKPPHDDGQVVFEKPDYDSSDDSSDDKEVDPELIELYKKVLEAFNRRHKHRKGQGGKDKPLFFIGSPEQKHKQHHHADGKPEIVITHPPDRAMIHFHSYHRGKPTGPPFNPSPQFNKYSEPDPLYHPNGNPFETYNAPQMPPAPPATPTPRGQATDAPELPPTQVAAEPQYPDSINAQLPPPENESDSSASLVSARLTPLAAPAADATPTLPTQSAVREAVPAAVSPPPAPLDDEHNTTENIKSSTEVEQAIATKKALAAPSQRLHLVFLPTTGIFEETSTPAATETPLNHDSDQPTTPDTTVANVSSEALHNGSSSAMEEPPPTALHAEVNSPPLVPTTGPSYPLTPANTNPLFHGPAHGFPAESDSKPEASNENKIQHKAISKQQFVHVNLTDKKGVKSHFSIKSAHAVNKHEPHTDQQQFNESGDIPENFHYIMSIINQARTHLLLSQNKSEVLGI